MTFSKMLLWVNCALFVAFGVGFVIAPEFLSKLITGAAPNAMNALTDMRATYGGMALGIGVFFGLCARKSSFTYMGLMASWLVFSSIAVSRLIGIIVDGSPNVFMLILLVAELLFVVLVSVAVKSIRNT